ncbi:MAG TPA: succinate dehydrogenase, cytochrome b556 subunit [Hyphomonadaceae bacterium]|nr:succinate dehydrogenase, cytochrome b556 subunit [Hyphomonadaceae bacterium]
MSSWTDKRPMSPHTSIWKWHITMASSILHRVTGVGNYIGIFIVVAWLFVTTTGQENYDQFSAVTGSIPGMVILFGFTLSICYHLLNGIRHLVMDAGMALNPKTGSFTATLALLAAIVLAVVIFIGAGLIPGLDPLHFQGATP